MAGNPITPTIPLDAQGIHHGHLRLPNSVDASAWGNVMIPLTVIANGEGPTALLSGGNHGDEYEGPVALHRLAASLRAEDIRGRVIIVPAMNHPAFLAARRTSPIDGANMNRIYPGRADGSASQKIADYFARALLPMAEVVLDVHSGGKTLEFLPFAASHILDDAAQDAACAAAARAFAAPFTVRMREIDSAGMYDGEAEGQGKIFVTTELGGGGSATAETVAIAERGARNLLIHAGILRGQAEAASTQMLEFPEEDGFVFATDTGLVDFCVDLGATVAKGDLIARVWQTAHTGRAPAEYRSPRSGILAGRHFPGLIGMGDCLAVLAVQPQ